MKHELEIPSRSWTSPSPARWRLSLAWSSSRPSGQLRTHPLHSSTHSYSITALHKHSLYLCPFSESLALISLCTCSQTGRVKMVLIIYSRESQLNTEPWTHTCSLRAPCMERRRERRTSTHRPDGADRSASPEWKHPDPQNTMRITLYRNYNITVHRLSYTS